MKALKPFLIALLAYVALVATFESLLGYFQPTPGNTLVISVANEDGEMKDRVVSRLEHDGKLYVAANHWPRAWYRDALERPQVEIVSEGESGTYQAVSVSGPEHERVDDANRLGLGFRFMTGFPPRYFLRLDAR